MEENENKKIPSLDGIYDCVVTGCRRQERHFGKDAMMHLIISVGVRRADTENGEIYYAELPLAFSNGNPWDFYDRENNRSVTRPCTSDDTVSAIEAAKEMFPAWESFCDALPEGASMGAAFGWFFGEEFRGQKVRAKLKNRFYQKDGEDKTAHDAILLKPLTKTDFDINSFDASFGASLASAGVKIGKAVAKASKPAPKSAPAPKMPPRRPAPAAKKVTGEDAWAAYEGHCLASDPNGEHYWERVAEIVGKDAADQADFTSDDWAKCVSAFKDEMPF